MKPKVFIGSSRERLNVAEAIKHNLERTSEAQLWSEGVFELSNTTIGSIEKKLDTADFAIMVLGADDVAVSRGAETRAPRDNVVFELGLFMGRLGRERVFFVIENDQERGIKLPSDLAGVTAATYSRSDDLKKALGAACTMIRDQMSSSGLRMHRDFCERIRGRWWERLVTERVHGLSCFRMETDPVSGNLKMREGRGYDTQGRHVSNWSSIATCVNQGDNALFYYWTGQQLGKPGERQGFGEIRFAAASGVMTRGTGSFADTNLSDLKSTQVKTVEVRRLASKDDEDKMQNGDSREIAALVTKILKAW